MGTLGSPRVTGAVTPRPEGSRSSGPRHHEGYASSGAWIPPSFLPWGSFVFSVTPPSSMQARVKRSIFLIFKKNSFCYCFLAGGCSSAPVFPSRVAVCVSRVAGVGFPARASLRGAARVQVCGRPAPARFFLLLLSVLEPSLY